MKKSAFSGYHPLVLFTYFTFMFLFTMFFMHPVCLVLSFLGAISWLAYLIGGKALRLSARFLVPFTLLAAIVNPMFSHEGQTILTYLPGGNPLTLESIIYGILAALMLAGMISWFSCFNVVMTSDKFVYLFGRVIPALSLILSMALRFVPRFKAQFKLVSNAQKCIGHDLSQGSVLSRVRHGVRILSIMVTWSLENAIETADSMRSRGYGKPGRTAFSLYRFDERDKSALAVILGFGAYILIASLRGDFYWRFYPSIRGVALSAWSVFAMLAYLALAFTPLIIDLWEDKKWKHLQ